MLTFVSIIIKVRIVIVILLLPCGCYVLPWLPHFGNCVNVDVTSQVCSYALLQNSNCGNIVKATSFGWPPVHNVLIAIHSAGLELKHADDRTESRHDNIHTSPSLCANNGQR
jgi:hypothetical protein